MDTRPLFASMSAVGGSTSNPLQPDPAPTQLQIFAIIIIFLFPALALVVVIARAAGRLATRQFGWDDWLICIAMILSLGETVVSYFFIKTNFVGIHLADVPRDRDPTEALIWAYGVQILYNPILALVKTSMLLFLLRLFGQKDGIRRFIIGLNVVNMLHMVTTFFAVTLQCTPISFNWDPTVPGGHCIDRRILFTSTSAFNIVTDLLVLGLPLWIFIDLKIPRRAKLALLIVFLLGFIVTITSIVRLVILVQGLFGLIQLSDPTFNIGFVTSAIETNLALITASAPALRPFFRNRDRGGVFGRSTIAPTKNGGDVEANRKPFSWPLSAKGDRPRTPKSPKPRRLSRSSSRGSGRGGRRGGRGRGGAKKYDIRIRRDNLTELRSHSPRRSEEEVMTANGIMRVSDIQREIDGIVQEIAVEGSGTYTGINALLLRPLPATSNTPPPSRRGNKSTTAPRLLTNFSPSPPLPPPAPPRTPSGDSNVNSLRDTGFDFFNRIPPPTDDSQKPARRAFPERHYSKSVYPELDYATPAERREGGRGRDYNEERMSKYGDRRFGVVTPRTGNTPTSSQGWRESGRPF